MNKKNKSNKKFYCKNGNAINKRKEELTEMLTGVLITTDKNKEKNSVRDAYNILNDAIEHLYPEVLNKIKNKQEAETLNQNSEENENENFIDQPPTPISENIPQNQNEINSELTSIGKITKKQKISEDQQKTTKTSNISDLLENELKGLRNNKAKMFYNFDTNCKGVVFIKIDKNYKNDIDIKHICKYIVNNIKNTKEQISKNIARFIPVEIAMKAKFENFEKNAHEVLDKYFFPKAAQSEQTVLESANIPNTASKSKKTTWKLEFKARNNNSINKDDYLEYMLKYIDKDKFIVDYKNPELTVLIEITNDLLCLSVLEDYLENKSYNLLTLSKSEDELKSERDRLMAMQKEREDEKLREREKRVAVLKNANSNKAELVNSEEIKNINKIEDENLKEENSNANDNAENEEDDGEIELI